MIERFVAHEEHRERPLVEAGVWIGTTEAPTSHHTQVVVFCFLQERLVKDSAKKSLQMHVSLQDKAGRIS